MSTTTLTATDFESTVTDDGIVLVDLWASWCGPCRELAPVFKAAALSLAAAVRELDTDDLRACLAEQDGAAR